MLTRIETALRRWRRRFSRSEWMVRLLKLPTSKCPPSAHGLVLIQIDGLAYPQLQKALAKNRMPFLQRLIRKEHYHLEHMFPGVPSTTPAVQAELFYGVRAAVPAFAFMMRDTQQLVRMYDPDAATRVEARLQNIASDPLLKGGSSYLSLFRAGTDEGEAHFCPASLGWGPALRNASPWKLLALLASNLWGLLRTAGLLIVETVLALVDLVRGVIQGQNFLRELMFVPTRVAVTILMRELCTFGVKMDIARGMPVIYINLLGYDEQSHRRGPDSAFAHWTLKGIDDAIGRIWRAAHRSERRHYDVWIFSDHGQEHTEPYETRYGRTLGEALTEALSELPGLPREYRSAGRRAVQLEPARLFGAEWIEKFIPGEGPEHPHSQSPLALTGLGPMAMLYNLHLGGVPPAQVAQRIVERAGVPLVLYRSGPEDGAPVHGWCKDGPVKLPEDGLRLMGEDHPFAAETTADLVQLCRHPDAGDFIMCGWCAGERPMTFAVENGSHGGPGPNETHAFALLPADFPPPEQGYWRAEDLRRCAQTFLREIETPPAPRPQTAKTLRVMTYNVHSCLGLDGKYSPRRVARIIARYRPDVVALQELDVTRSRSGGVNQAEQIAKYLAMDYHFHPAIHMENERYGDAILSRLPMRLVKKGILPGPPPRSGVRLVPKVIEPRGAIWIEVQLEGEKLQILNTHLGLDKLERLRQIDTLLGPEWLAHIDCQGPTILMGDFNALPNSVEYKRLCGRLHDVQLLAPRHKPKGTFPSRMKQVRIDYIFVERHLRVKKTLVPRNELTKLASDHLPLIADIQLP
ncbi:endonuclease/exonuclease/phosphatase family protein [Microbulbifer thermotolerans]|uniref:endonuclease/exonuclease/phosphatase family protein n=1 Tax=Microbulbifer thermotolerans TaxID=252514 RepID=UPI00224A5B3A|nr:endonuclease/exonuclease/phosphatase family protein [Microbulbifer thermotolerans]MCX2779337.1 endonuclease/exonuclease/phosphatase family protein [Microbulbifer thermotolerans]MCX2805761.1 endonuclease/exonuclease/phosphatase family protein [Microbulbifer thermotolerans]